MPWTVLYWTVSQQTVNVKKKAPIILSFPYFLYSHIIHGKVDSGDPARAPAVHKIPAGAAMVYSMQKQREPGFGSDIEMCESNSCKK